MSAGVEETVRELLRAGANASRPERNGDTPLHAAVGRGDAGATFPLHPTQLAHLTPIYLRCIRVKTVFKKKKKEKEENKVLD